MTETYAAMSIDELLSLFEEACQSKMKRCFFPKIQRYITKK